MGDPVDLTANPIFVAKDIDIFIDPNDPSLIRVVGYEQEIIGANRGCSYYTTNTTKANLDKNQLEKLRKALSDALEKLG